MRFRPTLIKVVGIPTVVVNDTTVSQALASPWMVARVGAVAATGAAESDRPADHRPTTGDP